MVTVSPYKIDVPQEVIDDLWERLHRTRWPDEVAGTGWRRGCDLSYMKELVKYWIDEYDWRNQETALNQHNHYQGNVDGLNIHFLHEKGKGPNPMPLFMMHGYPRDMIITNVMLYWVTNSFWSAIRLYSESYCHPWELMPGARIEVPTAVAAYPHELAPIVRKRAERYYNVVHFNKYSEGGHFAIHERAEEMSADLREFFRPLRGKEFFLS